MSRRKMPGAEVPPAPAPETLFAFWASSEFPYLLGGTVKRIGNTGQVETVEYGPGYCFNPTLLLPLAAGRPLMGELRDLQSKYKQDQRDLRDAYVKKAQELFRARALPLPGAVK